MTGSFTHGFNGYNRHGCRCEVCKTTMSTYWRARGQERAQRRRAAQAAGLAFVVEGITHGLSGYTWQKCRCEVCVQTWNAYCRNYGRTSMPTRRGGSDDT